MAQNKYEVLVAAAGDYIYYNITHHHVSLGSLLKPIRQLFLKFNKCATHLRVEL